MAEVELYLTINGRTWEKGIALEPGVQAELDEQMKRIQIRAEARLAAHRADDGHNLWIEHGRGKVDRSVSLCSDRGMASVLSAEFGHRAYRQTAGNGGTFRVGASKGIHVLTGAAGFVR